jgi:CHAT domain
MVSEIEIYFERNFTRCTSSTSVRKARQLHVPFIIVMDDFGKILTLLNMATLNVWSDNETIESMRDYWPTLYTLSESEATDVYDVDRFFRDDLTEQPDVPGVVLVDQEGQPTAILSREILLFENRRNIRADQETLALIPGKADSGDILENYVPQGGQEAKIAADLFQDENLKVARHVRLQFPAQVSLNHFYHLTITINRQEIPGVSNQFKLELTSKKWPIKLIASLRNIQPTDFRIQGPSYGIIEVPRSADSTPFTFTLIPQRTGKKKIKILFEQIGEMRHNYLAMPTIQTEVVATGVEITGEARVLHAPALTSVADPPDITIYVDQVKGLKYRVSVRIVEDKPDPSSPPRQVDEIIFTSPPQTYIQKFFNDLDAKTINGLSPTEFDEEVKLIGNTLYDQLFHEDGFKAFYWNSMATLAEGSSVQIVSQEPYIPWEILRPFRLRPDGKQESDPFYFCQRFALSRWMAGPQPGSNLPFLKVILVAPPSDLHWVQDEVEAIRNLPGLDVKIIKDKQTLLKFFKTGEADVVHFACHGVFQETNPGRSEVLLGNRSFLRPEEIVAENSNFGRVKPLVFLNACDSGRQGIGLTGLDGWANAFTEKAGAGFFIGSLWKATDQLAYTFARVFYEKLQSGFRVGESMRQARQIISKQEDATYLSYTLYGNPRIRARSM